MSHTPSDDEGLRGAVVRCLMTESPSGKSVLTVEALDRIMALISKKIREARVDELSHIKILHRREVYTDISGEDENIRDHIATLTTKQDTKEG